MDYNNNITYTLHEEIKKREKLDCIEGNIKLGNYIQEIISQ